MSKLGEAYVVIRANLKTLKSDLAKAYSITKTAVSDISSAVKTIAAPVLWGWHAFTSLLRQAIHFALGLSAAITGLAYLTAKQEEAEFDLAVQLKNTGEYTDELLDKLKKFSSEMQTATGHGDESVLSLMQVGLAMGISSGRIEEATKRAIGLSAAYKMDLNTSMKMVALAYENQFSMLGRYLPALRSAEEETNKFSIAQILLGKHLEGQLSASEKSRIAFEAMDRGFALASERAKYGLGPLRLLKDTIGDTGELIGAAFLPGLQKMAENLTIYLNENAGAIQEWASNMSAAISAFWEKHGGTIGAYVKSAIGYLIGFVQAMTQIGYLLITNWDETWSSVKNILTEVGVTMANMALDIGEYIGSNLGRGIIGGAMKQISKLADTPLNPLGWYQKQWTGKGLSELVDAQGYWGDFQRGGMTAGALRGQLGSTLSAGGERIAGAANPEIAAIWMQKMVVEQQKNNQYLQQILQQNQSIVGAF